MPYRITEHTADLGIEATGADLGEALAEAARGLAEVVTGQLPPRTSEQEVHFTLEAPDEGALVVAFLSELLWVLDGEGLLWTGGGVEVVAGGPGWIAKARGNAVQYDAAVHGRGVEVKAVTYHELEVRRGPAGVTLRVLLDI